MSSQSLLETIRPALPPPLDNSLSSIPDTTRSLINTLLHFAVGANCPHDRPELKALWSSSQAAAVSLISQFVQSQRESGQKRLLDTSDDSSTPSKKARLSPASDDAEDDAPLFTLHALSLTAPIRKKADITIHRASIRLTNPSTHAQEHAPIPLSTIRAAFLLPTRGKTKPHWSVLLLPAPTEAKDKVPHLAFGLDATPPGFVTTSYPSGADSGERTAHSKGTPALASLKAFLSHLTIPVIEPSPAAFRSSSGEGGVEAYRGAKPGTLWFLPEGILWDGKPAEWYPLSEIARATDGVDGVRTLSATGRTCSVLLRKVLTAAEKAAEREKEKDKARGKGKGKEKQVEDEEDGEEEGEEVVEIDFGMVDGKEQEGIGRWVKQHRSYFSKSPDSTRPPASTNAEASPSKAPASTNGRTRSGRTAGAIPAGGQEDASDESDEDFEADSSDGGSATSDDESEDEAAGSEDVASGSGSDDEEGEEDGEEEEGAEEDLDPAHHPLLRPGAMPRMSKAALDAVVGMVEADLKMGVGRGGTRGVESEESEEDELED